MSSRQCFGDYRVVGNWLEHPDHCSPNWVEPKTNLVHMSDTLDEEVWYRLKVCVSPKFVCWDLTSDVMVWRGGAFGSWLGHEVEL